MGERPSREEIERFLEAEIERLERELVRHRIAFENLREFKDDVPNPALAARVYRSLLEQDPPDVETAKDKRAELREWAEQGKRTTRYVDSPSRPPCRLIRRASASKR